MPMTGGQKMYKLPNLDRKSTRLNSSHLGISYAVFCLKKKRKPAQLQCKRVLELQVCGSLVQSDAVNFEALDHKLESENGQKVDDHFTKATSVTWTLI